LQRAGIGDGECYEYWNLEHPEKVRAIHESYVAAGAEVLVTNTFQANPVCLERFGLSHELEAIAKAGIALAREVAGPDRFVLASMGPLPAASTASDLQRTVASLTSADAILVETASTLCDLPVLGTHAHPLIPILLSLTFRRTEAGSVVLPKSSDPCDLLDLLRGIQPFPLAALGVNCGRDVGLDGIMVIVRRFRAKTDFPVFVRPNAGTPTRVTGHWEYPLTPQALADRLPELLAAGVRMIGGCCGTTPEHIAALRPIIDAYNLNGGCAT
jgi:5-methyltetrahydrofolate--homocysteine methyltransferase